MDWKREAIDKLRNYNGRKASLARVREEMHQLEEESRAIKSQLEGTVSVKGGGGSDDALVRNIALRGELKQAQKNTVRWLSQVEGALAFLTEEETLVLEWFYMRQGKGAADYLCQRLALERSSVYRRRDEALRKFTVAYYGAVES